MVSLAGMSPVAREITRDFLADLRHVVGADGVIARANELLVYECDAFTMEKNLPDAVVLPRTTEEVVAVVKLCARRLVRLCLFRR